MDVVREYELGKWGWLEIWSYRQTHHFGIELFHNPKNRVIGLSLYFWRWELTLYINY